MAFCPRCEKRMGQTDTVCPHCKYDFPAHELATAGPRGGKSGGRGMMLLGVLLLLVAAAVAYFFLQKRLGLPPIPGLQN